MEPDEQVSALLADIPQNANALGQAAAPITLEYFADLQCPFCRDFSLGVLPSIIQRWVRAGTLRVEYRALETATRDPEVFVAQQAAALAAGKQAKAWHFIETFYEQQGPDRCERGHDDQVLGDRFGVIRRGDRRARAEIGR
jgi:protein-disulfide isomerase